MWYYSRKWIKLCRLMHVHTRITRQQTPLRIWHDLEWKTKRRSLKVCYWANYSCKLTTVFISWSNLLAFTNQWGAKATPIASVVTLKTRWGDTRQVDSLVISTALPCCFKPAKIKTNANALLLSTHLKTPPYDMFSFYVNPNFIRTFLLLNLYIFP